MLKKYHKLQQLKPMKIDELRWANQRFVVHIISIYMPNIVEIGQRVDFDLWPWFIPHPYERTGLHFDAILVCRQLPHQLLLRWVPFFVGPSWQHLSSSISANQVLSWSLELPNRVLAMDCVVVWANQCSLLSLTVFTKHCCPVLFLSSSSVTLSFQDMSGILLCRLWCTLCGNYGKLNRGLLIFYLLAIISLYSCLAFYCMIKQDHWKQFSIILYIYCEEHMDN